MYRHLARKEKCKIKSLDTEVYLFIYCGVKSWTESFCALGRQRHWATPWVKSFSSLGKQIQRCRNLRMMWLRRVRFSPRLLFCYLYQFPVIPKMLLGTYCSVPVRDDIHLTAPTYDAIHLTAPICGNASSGGSQPARRIQEHLGFCNRMAPRF